MFRAAAITELTKLATPTKCGQFCDLSKTELLLPAGKHNLLKVAELNCRPCIRGTQNGPSVHTSPLASRDKRLTCKWVGERKLWKDNRAIALVNYQTATHKFFLHHEHTIHERHPREIAHNLLMVLKNRLLIIVLV